MDGSAPLAEFRAVEVVVGAADPPRFTVVGAAAFAAVESLDELLFPLEDELDFRLAVPVGAEPVDACVSTGEVLVVAPVDVAPLSFALRDEVLPDTVGAPSRLPPPDTGDVILASLAFLPPSAEASR